MKKQTKKSSHKNRKKAPTNRIYLICWIIIPLAIIVALVLDGFGVYLFNTERLLVMGVCILVVLTPFFSEVTIKNISIKKEET